MKPRIEEYFDQHSAHVLARACEQYGINPAGCKRLGSFENFVFECEQSSQSRILRLTDSEHRRPDMIRGELEWIRHLADGGVSVSGGVESNNGKLVEVIPVEADSDVSDEELFFSAVMFDKAPGDHAGPSDWNETLFEQWGEMTGRMHRLAKSFQPSRSEYKRKHWIEDEDLKIDEILPSGHELVVEKFDTVTRKLNALPADRDSFGLIHVDFHQGNFFVHEGKITLFDFDDCHYDYFANDIAIPLFYAARSAMSGSDPVEFARIFLSAFARGYRKENDLPVHGFDHLHDFMKLREILLYAIILSEEADKESEWCRKFLAARRERIESEQPVIDIDFARFAR
jgi:Ser/Thr protein kinase RdoA (MazF antagonist)